jgi:hypothetical protein
MAVETTYIINGLVANVVERTLYKAGVDALETKALAINPAGRDKSLYQSALGTPVYADFTVEPFQYTTNGVTFFVPGIKLATLIIEVTKQKNIVKTIIQGSKGSVNEYIGTLDDVVVISGVIAGSNGIYPYNEVSDLNKLLEAPVAFKVVSRWLQNLNIDNLIIVGADIPQREGGYSYQDFRIYCETDVPIELNIISASNTTQ